jgi:hypothetical protein
MELPSVDRYPNGKVSVGRQEEVDEWGEPVALPALYQQTQGLKVVVKLSI